MTATETATATEAPPKVHIPALEPPAGHPGINPQISETLESAQAPPRRHRRHAAPEPDDDDLGTSTAAQVQAEADPDADEVPHGRHGGGGGPSASELIARSRSTASGPRRVLDPLLDLAVPLAVQHTVELLTVGVGESVAAKSGELDLPERKSRAGRNLPAATAVGLGLGAVVVVSLLAYRPSFVVLLGLAAVLGSFELVRAIATLEARAPLLPVVVGGIAMDVAAWQRGPDGLVGALMLTVLGVCIWRLADGASGYRQDVAAGTLVALYVPFLAGFAALLAHPSDGAARVIIFIAAVVCSDTGGYTAGVLFGKHPMAPMVSPKKSWEGFAGSVIGSCVVSSLIMVLTFHHEWWKGAIFGVAIAVVATLGDLGESMIKRDLAIKDMGELLPGHGGVMDRLDSLLPCAPVAYLLLSLFLRT